jgi:hypothetical protein
MEAAEAVTICLTRNSLDLGVEAEVGWRLVPGVDLEVLRDRIDAFAEKLQ